MVIKRYLHSWASLKLTLGLLTFAFLLVFFGTLYQVEFGIYEAQKHYFQSWVIFLKYPSQAVGSRYLQWIRLPLLGGYAVGSLLVINLVADFLLRFKLSYQKLGLNLLHGGVLLLIISGFISAACTQESQMTLYRGKPTCYSEHSRENELVVIDTTHPEHDHVVGFPTSMLRPASVLAHHSLPFQVQVEAFFPNSVVGKVEASASKSKRDYALQGVASKIGLRAAPAPVSYKQDAINTASAYITLKAPEGSLGTWLVSNVLNHHFPYQLFHYNGKTYALALRFKRFYLPYSLDLLEFKHETYPGTDIPRHFSSLVKIKASDQTEERPAFIYMNHPLRYQGNTFYQASFIAHEGASILQVVHNPGWMLPYLCLLIIGLGLVVHFSIQLHNFLKQKT